jgi:hypothetical protein
MAIVALVSFSFIRYFTCDQELVVPHCLVLHLGKLSSRFLGDLKVL